LLRATIRRELAAAGGVRVGLLGDELLLLLLPPSSGWPIEPFSISEATFLTVLIGIAKPTPLLVPDSLAICALMPMTWPLRFSSGPPELPGLMAASVWIAPSMAAPLGDWIWRSRAETMPLVRVP
jgi:hypothetical protein